MHITTEKILFYLELTNLFQICLKILFKIQKFKPFLGRMGPCYIQNNQRRETVITKLH